MRAVTYARVSSSAQRERDTIASQLRTLPEYVARQGWTLARPVGTYVDDGHTAKAGHLAARTGLAALLRDAATGTFDVVVVVELDRLTRAEDLAERGAILGALQRAGVRVASAASGQVLDLSTSSGDLISSLQAFFAAEWARKHRERITQGKLTAIARGRKPSGPTPYGLAYARDTGAWSLHVEHAAIAREIVERVVAGDSCRRIGDDLHARAVPAARSGAWSAHRVWAIVRSRHLIGEWDVDKRRKLTIAVPPIVTPALWHQAQAALIAHGRRGLRKTKHVYLLEGLATCAACGGAILIRSGNRGRGNSPNPPAYVCRNRKLTTRAAVRCSSRIVKTSELDARVWARIRAELADPDLGDELARRAALDAADRHDWTGDAAGYRKHLARLGSVEEGILERYRRGKITDAGFDRELAAIERERSAVGEQLATAERAAAAEPPVAGDPRAWLAALQELADDPSPSEAQRIVRALLALGTAVLDDGRLRFTIRVGAATSRVAGDGGEAALVLAPASAAG